MKAFRASLPLTATSFVNKVGTIGLSLLPVLLVERQVAIGEASLIMGLTKAMALVAAFLGGVASDRLGMKKVLLVSFGFSAVGLFGMASVKSVLLLAAFAMLAQLGNNLFHSPARLLLTEMVEKNQVKEAIAWLRTGNNAGQIVSFSIGSVFASLGTALLIYFDAITSLLAVVCGMKWLPEHKPAVVALGVNPEEQEGAPWGTFARCTLIVAGFSLVYEFFLTGAAAKYRIAFGPEGVRIFSLSMVINTVLCALFSVHAARMFKNPARVLPLGLFLQMLGAAVALEAAGSESGFATRAMIYGGMFLTTLGEIVFGSLSQVVILQTLPKTRAQGSVYGFSMMVQMTGRIIGGTLAIPMIAYGTGSGLVVLALGVPFLGLALFSSTELRKLEPEVVRAS
ncbi:MAG: MFS transporter [Bdellovibrionia bacterium]